MVDSDCWALTPLIQSIQTNAAQARKEIRRMLHHPENPISGDYVICPGHGSPSIRSHCLMALRLPHIQAMGHLLIITKERRPRFDLILKPAMFGPRSTELVWRVLGFQAGYRIRWGKYDSRGKKIRPPSSWFGNKSINGYQGRSPWDRLRASRRETRTSLIVECRWLAYKLLLRMTKYFDRSPHGAAPSQRRKRRLETAATIGHRH